MFQLNKGISTLNGILIIVVYTFLVGGILVWQLEWLKNEVKIPEVELPEGKNTQITPPGSDYKSIHQLEWEEHKKDKETITDETANWKTYRNEEYGFEFKYPNEITFSSPTSTPRYVFMIDSWINQKRDKNKPAVGLFISLLSNSGEQMLKEEKDLWSRQTYERLEIQEVKIGEAPGLIVKNVLMTVSDTGEGVGRIASVILDTFKDKYFYSFQCSQDGNNWDKCDQILSTFQFLE